MVFGNAIVHGLLDTEMVQLRIEKGGRLIGELSNVWHKLIDIEVQVSCLLTFVVICVGLNTRAGRTTIWDTTSL